MKAQEGPLDRITLRGLRVFGHHGVLDAERREGQEFVIDATVWVPTAAAAQSDDLWRTADYAALADRLAAVVAGPPVRLIETLAQRLADAALAEPLAREAEITVHKPYAPIGHHYEDVSVTIRRPAPGPGRNEPGPGPGALGAGGPEPAGPCPGPGEPGAG